MNRLEKLVYDLVKDHPSFKAWLVRLYQRAFSLIPQPAIRSAYPVTVRKGFFFGFHDKSPFSADNVRLLSHRNLIGNRTVEPGDAAEVGFFTGADWKDYTPVATTRAWDWQLGSMLQWVGSNQEQLIFNDIVDGRIGSRIVTVTGAEVRSLAFPVAHISPDGQLASSYCFRRVAKAMDGYGVRFGNDADVPVQQFACDDPSEFRVFSIVHGRTVFAVSLADVRAIEPHPSMNGAFHFFHHSLFSPAGSRLFFLHRWVDGRGRLWSRMFSCNRDGSDWFLFPTDGMVSHIGWVNEDSLIAYARTRDGGDGYYLFRDRTGACEAVLPGRLNSDGHPMWSPLGDAFVTDTYPDRYRNQYLYLVSMPDAAVTKILQAHLVPELAEDQRVDLHPRFDRTGRVICFDSGHLGCRSLCTVRLPGERVN